jgi:uncharacterized protein (DUF1330 family)
MAGSLMSAYIVLDVVVRDPLAYEGYKQLAGATVAAYGGRYLVRGGAAETLEGSWQPSRLVILEFPSVEQARTWWTSPEYEPAKAIRQGCATTEMLLVEGHR